MIDEIRERRRILKIAEELDKAIENMSGLNRFAKIVDSLQDAREIIGNVLKYQNKGEFIG